MKSVISSLAPKPRVTPSSVEDRDMAIVNSASWWNIAIVGGGNARFSSRAEDFEAAKFEAETALKSLSSDPNFIGRSAMIYAVDARDSSALVGTLSLKAGFVPVKKKEKK